MSCNVKCFICGTEFNADDDLCPCCEWFYLGFEDKLDEEEYDSCNLMTIKQAKDNYAKGLNVWGKPIKADAPEKK